MNYRIAVCEDEPAMRRQLSKLCTQALAELDIPGEIRTYCSAEELEQALLSDAGPAFDLLLLDIQLTRKSGLELARERRLAEDDVSIVFVTGNESFLKEGYSVQPVQFLLKPVELRELREAIRTDWRRKHRSRYASFREGHRTVILPAGDIRYVESVDHGSLFRMTGGEERFLRTSLTETERILLPTGRFCRCHNSFLVNMDRVSEIGRNELTLRDGQRIPVGRRYYASAQKTLISYMNR